MYTINMKRARKVYRAELAKGERRSFRAWARLIYAAPTSATGKLLRIVGGGK